MFVETETARELTADRYEITLNPLAASRQVRTFLPRG
jgi:hypothetical protein